MWLVFLFICFCFVEPKSPHLALAGLELSKILAWKLLGVLLHYLDAGIGGMRHHRYLQMVAADSPSPPSPLLFLLLFNDGFSFGWFRSCRVDQTDLKLSDLPTSAGITGTGHHAQLQMTFWKACSSCVSDVVKAASPTTPLGSFRKYTGSLSGKHACFHRFQNTGAL